MNSVQQTILGLVLVGIAFVFGSYLHREESTSNPQQLADSEMQDLEWQGGSSGMPAAKHQGSSIPTLRLPQRQLPEIQSNELVEANLVPKLDSQESLGTLKQHTNGIAEPDFSVFSIDEESASDSETNAPLDLVIEPQIATPNFASHFPAEQPKPDAETLPPRPLRDEHVDPPTPNAGYKIITKRLDLSDQRPTDWQTNESYSKPIDKPARKTQTTVVSVRPRQKSPVMSKATRFKTHTSVRGETLQQLAIKYFGDADYYLDIYVANKSVLRNPAELPPGTTLQIPVYE